MRENNESERRVKVKMSEEVANRIVERAVDNKNRLYLNKLKEKRMDMRPFFYDSTDEFEIMNSETIDKIISKSKGTSISNIIDGRIEEVDKLWESKFLQNKQQCDCQVNVNFTWIVYLIDYENYSGRIMPVLARQTQDEAIFAIKNLLKKTTKKSLLNAKSFHILKLPDCGSWDIDL